MGEQGECLAVCGDESVGAFRKGGVVSAARAGGTVRRLPQRPHAVELVCLCPSDGVNRVSQRAPVCVWLP